MTDGPTSTVPVRTRKLRIPQSHGGCFTCKFVLSSISILYKKHTDFHFHRARKIRCDLKRPSCQRCHKIGKPCGGYRDSVTPDESSGSEVSAISPLSMVSDESVMGKLDCSWLIKLGCEVFHTGVLHQQGSAAMFWKVTVPQLGLTDTVAGTSMAVLGAAVNACLAPSTQGAILYSKHCGEALRCIQGVIAEPQSCSPALIVACLLLAVSEVLMGQELSALSHLQGTLLVLQQKQKYGNKLQCGTYEGYCLDDEIDAAGAIMDISTASYALGIEPRLPQFASVAPRMNASMPYKLSNEHKVLRALHSGYRFASTYNRWKYVPNQLVPEEAFTNQFQCCTELALCIQDLADLAIVDDCSHDVRPYILKAQCSTCLVYLENLLDPMETGYDQYLCIFQAMVEDSEFVMDNIEPAKYKYLPFSMDLGIIWPLFFTATRCRDLQLRLKALRLLEKTGREGPFDGPRFAVLAKRVIELETGPDTTADNDISTVVAEQARLHTIGIDVEESFERNPLFMKAVFARCRDIGKLLDTDCADEFKEPVHWEIWNELHTQ